MYKEINAIFFQIGSAWEYSWETKEKTLNSSYSLYKGLANQILQWFENVHNLQVLRLNLFDTYGPGDTRGKIVQHLINHSGNKTHLKLSPGEQILELVFVSDVASAVSHGVLFADQARQSGKRLIDEPTFWCIPEQPIKLRELVNLINAKINEPLAVSWGEIGYRDGEKFQRDPNKVRVFPNWKPEISYSDGISKVLNFSS